MAYEENHKEILSFIREIWSPLLIALLAYLTHRLNLTIKRAELHGNAELRARELYFDSSQKALDDLTKNTHEISKKLGGFLNDIRSTNNDRSRAMKAKKAITHLKLMYDANKSFYQDLHEKVLQEIATKENIDRIDTAIKIMEQDIAKFSENDYEQKFYDYMKATSLFLNIETTIREKERDKIFSKYLK